MSKELELLKKHIEDSIQQEKWILENPKGYFSGDVTQCRIIVSQAESIIKKIDELNQLTPPPTKSGEEREELREKAKEYVRGLGFEGHADHSLCTQWMVDFALEYSTPSHPKPKSAEETPKSLIEMDLKILKDICYGHRATDSQKRIALELISMINKYSHPKPLTEEEIVYNIRDLWCSYYKIYDLDLLDAINGTLKLLNEYSTHSHPKPLTEEEIINLTEDFRIEGECETYDELSKFQLGLKKANETIFKTK